VKVAIGADKFRKVSEQADLPIARPRKLEFVINLKAEKQPSRSGHKMAGSSGLNAGSQKNTWEN